MNRNYLRIFTPAILIFPLVAGAAFAVPASAADTRYITISATGTTTVVPDAVRINATVSVLSSTSKEARTISSSTAAALRASLAKNGVVTKDIATQSLTIYPEYSYPTSGTPTLSGYRASQSFDITIRKASTAGTVVDAIVESGGDNLQINGVSPFVLDNNKATETARTYAVGRAKAKANSYAKLLGIRLGRVIFLDEISTPTTYPIYTSAAKSDSAPTVVDLGEQKVSVTVTVRWAIGS